MAAIGCLAAGSGARRAGNSSEVERNAAIQAPLVYTLSSHASISVVVGYMVQHAGMDDLGSFTWGSLDMFSHLCQLSLDL